MRRREGGRVEGRWSEWTVGVGVHGGKGGRGENEVLCQ